MARRRKGRVLNGWLVIDKPVGMTSSDVVNRVRRLTDARKVGHAGTLDPLATGVLPIALGEATKCMSYVMDATKVYRFTVAFGAETDTDDAEGTVVRTAALRPDDEAIVAALSEFTGEIDQVPPRYSAIKVAGRRAYDLAREGAAPDLKARRVRVARFDLIARDDADRATFLVECGKGTYMRSLARDLGRRLGCFAHVHQLRRLKVGAFDEQAAISLDKLAELCDTSPPLEHLLPVQTALDDIPALAVTGVQADRLRCGQAIRALNAGDGFVCAMTGKVLVALARVEAGEVQPVRVFNL